MARSDQGWSYVGTTPTVIGLEKAKGSRAAGIYLLGAVPSEAVSLATPPRLVASGPDLEAVSYLACSSGPEPCLYAASSSAKGGTGARGRLSAWKLDPGTGAVTGIGAIESPGAGVAHLALSRTGHYLLAADYGRGSVFTHPLLADGSVGPLASEVVHAGGGPIGARQGTPHPHMVAVDSETGIVLVPDLGADRVFAYELDEERGTLGALSENTVTLPPGSGPRHLAFMYGRGLALLTNELAGTVALLVRDREGGYSVSDIVPSTSQRGVTNAPSGVRVSGDGQLAYVANRGPKSISVFRTDGSCLEAVQEVACGGDWPRDLVVDHQDGILLVANHRSHDVTVLRLTDSGLPQEPAGSWRVDCPNCLVIADVELG